MSEKYIVTVTRQFGSQGRPIAKKLAERLGWDYYDRDIILSLLFYFGKL